MSGENARQYRRHASRTYERTNREISRLYAKAHRIIDDWQHKTIIMLVKAYNLIVLEDLNLQAGKPRRNPIRTGRAYSYPTASR